MALGTFELEGQPKGPRKGEDKQVRGREETGRRKSERFLESIKAVSNTNLKLNKDGLFC